MSLIPAQKNMLLHTHRKKHHTNVSNPCNTTQKSKNSLVWVLCNGKNMQTKEHV
uniref:Uncharacterized protein n=1 Tax=Arundo donax TaxID=35708 RepID=A0A0A9FUL2_ARUDO